MADEPTRHSAEVARAISALENIHGQLTPELVLDAALDPASPLHKAFEWNDERAGHQYRIEQARALIRTVRYEYRTSKAVIHTVRYVHDSRAVRDSGYVNITRLDEAGLADATVAAEVERVMALITRGRGIAGALGRESEFIAAIKAGLK